jgi:PilZ domain
MMVRKALVRDDNRRMTFDDDDDGIEIPDDVEAILRRQDEAMGLLERLRLSEPFRRPKTDQLGARRREFRRWPLPEGTSLELHNSQGWELADVMDMGVGGARLNTLPKFADGPTPARLKSPTSQAVLVLCDVMWKDKDGRAGIRFEFRDEDERENWSGGLIDALLARHAVS